jgi:hypothetical protein
VISGKPKPKLCRLNCSPKKSESSVVASPTSIAIVTEERKIVGTTFSAELVLLLLRLVVEAAISMRATTRTIEITGQVYRGQFLEAPSHNTVGNLIQRVGLYEIMRAKEIADDWIWFIDHTIQAGVTKCLLVLGIRASEYRKLNRPLRCDDMSVLELLPVGKSTISIVASQMDDLIGRIGVPLAVVSDEGSDLVGGVKDVQKRHPGIVHCHDIVHKVSRIIDRILKNDSMWASYRTKCCHSGNSIRQTGLAHLTPPKPKTKARHMNLDPEIDWGVRVLGLLDRGHTDSTLSASEWNQLQEKLGWLSDYRERLTAWGELMQISKSLCEIVRREGYHTNVSARVKQALPAARTVEGQTLIHRSLAFLDQMQSRQSEDGPLPSSSEVIESVFGRGKRLEGQQSRSGFTTQLLAMAACVVKPTKQFIIDALKTCRTKHIAQWREDYLGRSLQSRRSQDLAQGYRTSTCGGHAGPNPKF